MEKSASEQFDSHLADAEARISAKKSAAKYDDSMGYDPPDEQTAAELILGHEIDSELQNGSSTITAADLMAKPFPEPKWVVDGLIPEGFTMIAGRPKVGKSYMSLQIATAVAVGMHLFPPDYSTTKGGVLYLALESSQRHMKDRLHQIKAPTTHDIHFATEIDAWPVNEAGLARLDTYLGDERNSYITLVVIDSLGEFFPGLDWNAYSPPKWALGTLKRIGTKHGVNILGMHHDRKMAAVDWGDEISGSVSVIATPDTYYVMKRGRPGVAGAYLLGRSREFEMDKDLAFDREKDGAAWELLGDGATFRMTIIQSEIVDALKEATEPIGPKDVAAMADLNYGTVKMEMYRMEREGRIRKTGYGKYESND